MTAGLLDRYENQDCDLESTIVKVRYIFIITLLSTLE